MSEQIPYCKKAQHEPAHFNVQDCLIYERDVALAQVKELEGVLREAEHSLITSQGLWATDKPDEYEDALREGADGNGARDSQREVTWEIDDRKVIQNIKVVLAGRGI